MTVSFHLLNAAAQVTAERIINSLLIGLALAASAWTLLRALPRPNSATRFAVWFIALLATAFLPFLEAPHAFVGHLAPAMRPLISVPLSWAIYLAHAWSVIAGLALLRVGVGFFELRRIRRSCRPIANADPAWQATRERVCPRRQVEILTSDLIHVPTALGFIRPAIILPSSLLEQLSPAELNQVLLHELAHLRRWDDWTNAVQKVVKALLFFHPAVWWIEERISLEREMACDDAVLAETSSPRAYAECLATLAEKSLLRRSAALAQAAVNHIRQTTLRVTRILDVNRPTPERNPAFALLGVFACACLGVASQMPRLVGFQDEPPVLAAASRVPEPSLSGQPAQIVAPPASTIANRKSPAVIQAKAVQVPRRAPGLARTKTFEVAEPYARPARVIPAKAAVSSNSVVTTGVLIIVVDDPVFGPTPIVYRFAVWQIAPSQSKQQETPQKTT